MKNLLKTISLLYTILFCFTLNTQAQMPCGPYAFCGLDDPVGLALSIDIPFNQAPSSYTVDLYFGPNEPLNGNYTSLNLPSNAPGETLITFPQIPCSGPNNPADLLTFQIVFDDGSGCSYIDGDLCGNCVINNNGPLNDCDDIFTNCVFELGLLIVNHGDEINCKQWLDDCGADGDIYRLGKVSIGTDKTSVNEHLTVKNGIVTDKVKVTCNGNEWCDYVFEEDYELKSLEEVSCFIEEYGHLHNTKPGADIEKEGSFELKSVTLNHQEKIEEIFLHLIDLKKEANTLHTRLQELKEENKKLKTRR